jgi:2-isopropylmalate synthase
LTYEIMRPEDVGLTKSDLVLGKHSGRAALTDRANALGYHLDREVLDTVFQQFKTLADKKKAIYDADLAAIIEQQLHAAPEVWSLDSYEVTAGTGRIPTVTLRVCRGGEVVSTTVSGGDGPIDAVFHAIEKIAGMKVTCTEFNVHSLTVGKDAQGEVMVILEHEGHLYRGRGMSTDSVEASAKAFLNAVNRIAAASAKG